MLISRMHKVYVFAKLYVSTLSLTSTQWCFLLFSYSRSVTHTTRCDTHMHTKTTVFIDDLSGNAITVTKSDGKG